MKRFYYTPYSECEVRDAARVECLGCHGELSAPEEEDSGYCRGCRTICGCCFESKKTEGGHLTGSTFTCSECLGLGPLEDA